MAAITGAVGRRRLMIDEKKLINNLTIRREKLRYISIVALHNNMNYVDTIINEINSIIDIINEQPKVGEWIPCSERLPEEEEPVLVQWEKYDRHLNITITYLDVMWLDDAEEEVFETINGVPNGKVVAWMPLPEPYSERIGGE